jgi:hypothetical protein
MIDLLRALAAAEKVSFFRTAKTYYAEYLCSVNLPGNCSQFTMASFDLFYTVYYVNCRMERPQ